jgi:hypothetical protein
MWSWVGRQRQQQQQQQIRRGPPQMSHTNAIQNSTVYLGSWADETDARFTTTSILGMADVVRSQHFSAPQQQQTNGQTEEEGEEDGARVSIFAHGVPASPNHTNQFTPPMSPSHEFCLIDTDAVVSIPSGSSSSSSSSSNVLCTVAQGVVASAATIAAGALAFQFGPAFSKSMSAGLGGVTDSFKTKNPARLDTYNPLQYVQPFVSAAFASGAMEAVKHLEGSADERNVEEILIAAQACLDAAQQATREQRGGWSDDQVATAQAWISEGRMRYRAFVHKQARSKPLLFASLTEATTATAPTTVISTHTLATPQPPPPPPPAMVPVVTPIQMMPSPPKIFSSSTVTVADMMEATRQAHQLRHPSVEQLAQEDGLNNLIDALDGLTRVPYLLPRVTEARVRNNIARHPAKGNATFINNVIGRVVIMVNNFTLPLKDRNKKTALLVSGPGTGKSVTWKQAAGWAELPMCVLPGSDYVGIPLSGSTTAFEVFAENVRKAVTEFRDVHTGELIPCGVLYGDDFDRAWAKNGSLAQSPACLERFFLFCKDVGDPNITTMLFKTEPHLFSWHLAPGRFFPINWSHIHWGVSCNSLPERFRSGSSVADPATLTRLCNLDAAYATAADRLADALDLTLVEILSKVAERLGEALPPPRSISFARTRVTREFLARLNLLGKKDEDEKTADTLAAELETELGPCDLHLGPKTSHIDLHIARRALIRVVAADWAICRDKFEGNLGIRGLSDALNQFQAYVTGRLPVDGDKSSLPAADLFAGWNASTAIAKLEAYLIPPETELVGLASAQELSRQLADERLAARNFPMHVREPILRLLDLAVANNSAATMSEKAAWLDQVRELARMWIHRVPLFSLEEAGRRLQSAFGYFQASGDGVGDVDRFPAVVTVFESIFWRLAALRSSDDNESSPSIQNTPITVRFTSPHAATSTLYTALAKDVFGGLPVRVVNDQLNTLFEGGDEYSVPDDEPIVEQISTLAPKYQVRISLSVAGKAFLPFLMRRKNSVNCTSLYYLDMGAGKSYVFKRSALPSLYKAGDLVTTLLADNHNSLDYSTGEDALSVVQKATACRLALLDHCFDADQRAEKSCAEAIVVLHLTPSVVTEISAWAEQYRGAGAGSMDGSSIERFRAWLGLQLSAPTWKLTQGVIIDPRGLSVFLVDDPAHPCLGNSNSNGNSNSHNGKLDWLVGLPPIEGRRHRALATIANELTRINHVRRQRATMLCSSASSSTSLVSACLEPIILNSTQETTLEHLLAYDLSQAQTTRTRGFELSPTPLDDAINDLLLKVSTGTNPYGLATPFPTLGAFTRAWDDMYRSEHERINAILEQRRLDMLAVERKAFEQAQMEGKILEARAHAEAEVAYKQQKQEAYKREHEREQQAERSTFSVPTFAN